MDLSQVEYIGVQNVWYYSQIEIKEFPVRSIIIIITITIIMRNINHNSVNSWNYQMKCFRPCKIAPGSQALDFEWEDVW